MGYKFKKVKQIICFCNGFNSCGVEMFLFSFIGQDVMGVNDGFKIIIFVIYLVDVWNWGVEMFCECEVWYI